MTGELAVTGEAVVLKAHAVIGEAPANNMVGSTPSRLACWPPS